MIDPYLDMLSVWGFGALRLVLVVVAGSIIGLEREFGGQAAGLRTHTMVGLGAALFTLLSEHLFLQAGGFGDRSRVIAGIAQGIGFLGAGTIIKDDNKIKGLTTAASIWFMGAVGIAFGLGAYGLGVISTIIAWVVLKPFKSIERRVMAISDRIGKKSSGN